MTPEELDLLADKVAYRIKRGEDPICTREEAMEIARCKTRWAWDQFKARRNVRPIKGRTDAYDREKVLAAARAECRGRKSAA